MPHNVPDECVSAIQATREKRKYCGKCEQETLHYLKVKYSKVAIFVKFKQRYF